MKKLFLLTLLSLGASASFASIPYCSGTNVTGGKHDALQYVIKTFADRYQCEIGNNCILNFDKVKYSIAWTKDCPNSARLGNSPKGSTFICDNGTCSPYGFRNPTAKY